MTGILKGYDQLLNLVLDEVQENLQSGKCDFKDVIRALGNSCCDSTGRRVHHAQPGPCSPQGADNHPPKPRGRLRGDRQPFPGTRVKPLLNLIGSTGLQAADRGACISTARVVPTVTRCLAHCEMLTSF